MINRSKLEDESRQVLENKYSFSTIEAIKFIAASNEVDLYVLRSIVDEQVFGMQVVLFKIMTTPYNFATNKVVMSMSYVDVLDEVDHIAKGNAQTYDGDYALIFNSLGLTRLHLNLISDAVWDKLTTCANYFNDHALAERNSSLDMLSRVDYREGLHRLDILSLDFYDKIKLLQTLNPIQLRVLEASSNIDYLRRHLDWVISTISSYYGTSVEEARNIAVSMILQEPQASHLESLGKVLYKYYRNIFSNVDVAFNQSVADYYNAKAIPKLRYKNSYCYLLGNSRENTLQDDAAYSKKLSIPKAAGTNNNQLHRSDGVEMMVYFLMLFSVVGYSLYLYSRVKNVKNACCRRFGFVHNLPNKKIDVTVDDKKEFIISKHGRII